MKNILSYAIALVAGFTAYAQDYRAFDVVQIDAQITPDFKTQTISAQFLAHFSIDKKTDRIFLDARVDEVWDVDIIQLEDKKLIVGATLKLEVDKIMIIGDFNPDDSVTVTFKYLVKPKQTMYFFGDQLWTQGQGKYTSYWLPSIDDMTDKISFNISVIVAPEFTVLSNGSLSYKSEQDSGLVRWSYQMLLDQMSSYLVMIAAGKFDKQELKSASGVTIENYYLQGDDATVEPTYRHTAAIFDFFEQKIGVPYPWQNYKQVPVRDFLYAGMENTTATVFSQAFVVDSIGFNDRNYVNVNAHELAHQWFGNLVTEVAAADHWLHEGFASYYALLAEREIFGDDYYYWKLFNTAEQLRKRSEQGKGQALSDPKASSLTFYEKGSWALVALNQYLGELTFDKVIRDFLTRFAYKNATLDDFFALASQVSGKDLTEFRKTWIDQTSFPAMKALNYLSDSPFIEEYVQLEILRNQALSEKRAELIRVLRDGNEYLGQEAVVQLAAEPIGQVLDLFDLALQSPHILVRQAVAQNIPSVPIALKNSYMDLLNDASYATQEIALYRLWDQFPRERTKLLDKTDGLVGFNDKNIRQLWLVLALVTSDYRRDRREDYQKELMDYATAKYSFETRQLALNYLSEIGIVNASVLKSLVNATVHPNWRFRSKARDLLDKQLDNPLVVSLLSELFDNFTDKEKQYLNTTVLKQ